MAFSRKTTRYYMDEEDLHGAYRAVCDKVARLEEDGAPTRLTAFYQGAALTIEIILSTDYIENQARFMALFDARKGGDTT